MSFQRHVASHRLDRKFPSVSPAGSAEFRVRRVAHVAPALFVELRQPHTLVVLHSRARLQRNARRSAISARTHRTDGSGSSLQSPPSENQQRLSRRLACSARSRLPTAAPPKPAAESSGLGAPRRRSAGARRQFEELFRYVDLRRVLPAPAAHMVSHNQRWRATLTAGSRAPDPCARKQPTEVLRFVERKPIRLAVCNVGGIDLQVDRAVVRAWRQPRRRQSGRGAQGLPKEGGVVRRRPAQACTNRSSRPSGAASPSGSGAPVSLVRGPPIHRP